MVHCGHREVDVVRNNRLIDCGAQSTMKVRHGITATTTSSLNH